jgi:hypothetical protein
VGFLKGIKDMTEMVAAAPGLIESSQQMAANAQAQQAAAQQMQAGGAQSYVNAMNEQNAGEPKAGNLEPIAGVTLETYTAIIRGLGAYGNDQSALPQIAQSKGIAPADWEKAKEGWGARIQDDRAIGSRFNTLYTQG